MNLFSRYVIGSKGNLCEKLWVGLQYVPISNYAYFQQTMHTQTHICECKINFLSLSWQPTLCVSKKALYIILYFYYTFIDRFFFFKLRPHFSFENNRLQVFPRAGQELYQKFLYSTTLPSLSFLFEISSYVEGNYYGPILLLYRNDFNIQLIRLVL